MNNLMSPLARQAIVVGRKNHWRFRVVSQHQPEWRFETITEAPTSCQERLQKLETAGIKVTSVVMAHEAPKLLNAPKPEPVKQDFKIPSILPDSDTMGLIFMGLITIFAEMFMQLILLDPAVIAVLEDGTWLEVMTWYE